MRIPALIAASALALTPVLAMAACLPAMPEAAGRTLVPAGRVDAALLDAALRAETNRVRCARGRAPLAAAPALRRQALRHSRWMAQTGRLGHGDRESLAGRARASGLRFARAAENVARVQRYRIEGGPFRIEDAAACRFGRGGARLGPHSYASLARHAVALWMASAGHRRNLLDPRLTRMAGAAAFAPGPHCGRFWLTQTFLG